MLQQLDLDFVYEDWKPPAHLIDKTRLHGVPRHGIGRSCKVGKEQIVGLMVALTRFVQTKRMRLATPALPGSRMPCARKLSSLVELRVRTVTDTGHGDMPLVEVLIEPGKGKPNAQQVAARLREATPAIYVDTTDADRTLMLVPTCLALNDVDVIGKAFAAAVLPLA